LALWQAHDLQDKLKANNIATELKIIKTKGDKIQDLSFDKIEGKGFFTKEIEDELIAKKIDVAVHSLKDLPTQSPELLVLAGLSERQDPADLLIINKASVQMSNDLRLRDGAVVGTSSVRRQSIAKDLAPHINIKELRGNVPTRIEKLKNGQYDAIILASAGINRLNIDLGEYHVIKLNPKEFVPAPGQGVIGYQCRESDIEMRKILSAIHNKNTAQQTNVERKVLSLMDGGCHIPLGVYAEVDAQGYYHVWASYAQTKDAKPVRMTISQSTSHGLAEKVVNQLTHQHENQ
jgi:hydroxymethylbilane synthase